MTNIFTYNDIISIVMEEVLHIEEKVLYNIENDEYNYSKEVIEKINLLNEEEYNEFNKEIEKIAGLIITIKNGELNELNNCASEIMYNIDSKWICE